MTEYEDIAISFGRDKSKLNAWRKILEKKRTTETLFDTKVCERVILVYIHTC